MAKRHWIKAAVAQGKGKLHEHLGVPKGEKIPEEKLRKAVHSKDSTIRKEANLAVTLKRFNPAPKKKKSDLSSKMYGTKKG